MQRTTVIRGGIVLDQRGRRRSELRLADGHIVEVSESIDPGVNDDVVDARGCIIVPGQPKAITECLDAVFAGVPYCIDLIGGPYLTTDPSRINAFRPGS